MLKVRLKYGVMVSKVCLLDCVLPAGWLSFDCERQSDDLDVLLVMSGLQQGIENIMQVLPCLCDDAG